ncbi:MerR family transcriptional regulator [Streptomyces sp. AV19]|uniref:MerR family transcriptional regulator n=1 Tax=Streptomyces sp. AV19 TaxID=2793068 RepID=UPI0018FE69D2|nr:MerR family transcriptional regulator [Streptomyces sp. AV19]MBH1937018.1 MerR family transcriptional regulator [Streptomyces sp. AV19]MDG4533066.1 MerR family transcriptional regulator [Streptomyces sp. AV19]
MRSTGDGTAVGSPYPLHGGTVEPVTRPHSLNGMGGTPVPTAAAVTSQRGHRAGTETETGGDATTGTDTIGYRGPTACAAAGITYRQLDYWARTGLVEPSVRPAYGSGSQRLYSFRDVVVLKIVKRLLDTGVSLQNIRTAVQHLRSRGMADLAQMTLMSDGATVYECSSPDEVVGLLQGGQGVFGIAVGVVWRDVESALAQLHGERVDTGETLVGHNPADELARRRNRAG